MSPKERLQNHPQAKNLAAMVSSEQFDVIAEVALLTFVDNLPEGNDATSSMCGHQQLVGAKRYLLTMRNLFKQNPPPPKPTGQLNPTA